MTEYTIKNGATAAVILPEKGATVVSLSRCGREFLYRDQKNLESPERPRCGIPFLFPIFGRLKDSQYCWEGTTYSMEIHGFGHTSVWSVAEHTESSLTLVLEDHEETLSMYPFRFRAELQFLLEEGTLTIIQRFENRDSKPMPYNFGFHPYFLLEELGNAQVETTANTYFDFTAGKALPFSHGTVEVTLPDGAPETGAAFMEVTGPTTLHIPAEGRRVTMEHGDDFPQIVLWTQAGKKFLCVEPINGTANGLNTGVYRTLNPGEHHQAALTIHIDHI